MWTARNFEDADICLCLRDPRCSVMSDTLAVSRRGALDGTIGSLSGYGWTARLLGDYARDRGVLTLAQAVHRITGRPAQRLELKGRGRAARPAPAPTWWCSTQRACRTAPRSRRRRVTRPASCMCSSTATRW